MASDIKMILSKPIHLYSTLLPQMTGRQTKLRLAPHSGNLTPPRISPGCSLCVKAEAEQGYHCRQRRSWRNSRPWLLWDGLNRWAPCCRSFDAGARLCTGGLGAPSESLISLLKLFSCRIWLFQGTQSRILPSPYYGEKTGV